MPALGTADFGDPPIVPGDAAASPLWRYVSGTDDGGTVMPPEDAGPRLASAELAVLKAWIDAGRILARGIGGYGRTPHDRPLVVSAAAAAAWSRTRDLPWIRNPIDAFVLAKLQQHELQPSPEADRRKLIRRLYLVVLGLPPSPEDVERFVHDPSPLAYEQLVDRVLSKPQYGERWARHWLDVVRFAETDGFETNRLRPNAFPYRDYVIDAFNQDKPYDQFVKEQICGDALGVDVGHRVSWSQGRTTL